MEVSGGGIECTGEYPSQIEEYHLEMMDSAVLFVC